MYFLKHNRFFQEQGAFRTKIQASVCGRISDPVTLQKVPERFLFRYSARDRILAEIEPLAVFTKDQTLLFICQAEALNPPDITGRVSKGIISPQSDSSAADLPESANDIRV